MTDLVIRGGVVIDGTGAPGRRADLAVSGGRIEALGDAGDTPSSAEVIDATGLVVSPGFIDTHAHSDAALIHDPQHANGVLQGITTEIICQDGLSYAPLAPERYREYGLYLSGLLGIPPDGLPTASFADFRAAYGGKGINVATLVPHGPIRLGATGFADRPLEGRVLEDARAAVRDGMQAGAHGFSTGLSYYPNSFSTTEELTALCEVVAAQDGVYVTHIRDHEIDRAYGGGGITEAIEIARRSGVKLHISHYRTWAHNAGHPEQILDEVDRAKADGIDITMETYPYPVGSTFPMYFLPAAFHDGGPDAILARLEDPAERGHWAAHLDRDGGRELVNGIWTYVGGEASHLQGVTFGEEIARRGVSLGTMVLDVMRESRLACGFRNLPPGPRVHRQIDADIMYLLRRPDYMVGSDAIPVGDIPHPRAWGTFPRIAGRLRRRFGDPLEQVINRMTATPARRFTLEGRGVIERGAWADLVVFDADRITDTATFDDPVSAPVGIKAVVVNGRVAARDGRVTGVLAGVAV